MKDRMKEQNRTMHEKQDMIKKLIKDNERQDKDYRNLLKKEGEKI